MFKIYKSITLLLAVFLFFGCKSRPSTNDVLPDIEITTLIEDSHLNIRAIDIVEDKVVAASANGEIIQFKLTHNKISHLKREIWNPENNEKPPHFRSIALINDNIWAMGIGAPAQLYKNGALVYSENHPKAFYDALAFWNPNEGIAIGDPTDSCMSILITRNGGKSWQKIDCSLLPTSNEGEAAFAASNGNISIQGSNTWVATGGKNSRILYSPNKGKTWQIYNTPIVQGKETTGLYAIDFYNSKIGFGIGGDYTKPENDQANKIRTQDGGKSWKLVAQDQPPGYRSSVQYVPNAKGLSLVAVGFKGIDWSSNGGKTWCSLSDEGFYTLRFLDNKTAIAAGKGKISLVELK